MERVQWFDTPERYGLISRTLHWGMALLFTWQFAGMVVRMAVGRAPITAFMVGSHRPIGTLLLVLALLRLAWALLNLRRRPLYAAGGTGFLARVGHTALYALMVAVPAIGLLRQYASGRSFAMWGIEVFAARPDRIDWLHALLNPLHGPAAWTLLALVAGHVLMALVHRWVWRDEVLPRMAGRVRRPA